MAALSAQERGQIKCREVGGIHLLLDSRDFLLLYLFIAQRACPLFSYNLDCEEEVEGDSVRMEWIPVGEISQWLESTPMVPSSSSLNATFVNHPHKEPVQELQQEQTSTTVTVPPASGTIVPPVMENGKEKANEKEKEEEGEQEEEQEDLVGELPGFLVHKVHAKVREQRPENPDDKQSKLVWSVLAVGDVGISVSMDPNANAGGKETGNDTALAPRLVMRKNKFAPFDLNDFLKNVVHKSRAGPKRMRLGIARPPGVLSSILVDVASAETCDAFEQALEKWSKQE